MKIAVGLSGGVDSGLAAALLKERSYNLVGVHIHLWPPSVPTQRRDSGRGRQCNRCCGNQLLKAARKTAKKLQIPFYEIDLKKPFKRQVVDKFIEEYSLGRTPNPCILCNKFVRFGELARLVKKRFNCDYLATGHYARIVGNHLLRAKDLSKDQSYFLYRLDQQQLAKVIFPLGDWYKKDVWRAAKKRRLPAASSQESFDVCFTDDLEDFLCRQLKPKPGKVVTQAGEFIGQHQGLPFYTIGQAGGWQWLAQAQKKFSRNGKLPKLYVVSKEVKNNQLVVGNRTATSSQQFKINHLIINHQSSIIGNLFVKIRSTGKLLPCQLKDSQVILKKPEFAITPGQSAVFYQLLKGDYEVIGGGLIV